MKFRFFVFLFYLLLIGCRTITAQEDSIPVHDTFTILSKNVNEQRIINVWTPSNYHTSANSFPVLYMADGGIKEDFPHLANTIAKLIQEKKITPIILVGIENTQRRRDLTGTTTIKSDQEIAPIVGGSEKFRAFIKDELFSEIEKRYRTSDRKGILGESLAGLFVMETFFLKPEMFDYYIAFDPSLWWNNHFLVATAKEHLKQLTIADRKLWFAGSSAKDISKHTRKLSKILTEHPLNSLKWNYSDEPKEKHATIFRATKEKALIWALN